MPSCWASHCGWPQSQGTGNETIEPRNCRGHEKRPALHPEAFLRRQIRQLFAGLSYHIELLTSFFRQLIHILLFQMMQVWEWSCSIYSFYLVIVSWDQTEGSYSRPQLVWREPHSDEYLYELILFLYNKWSFWQLQWINFSCIDVIYTSKSHMIFFSHYKMTLFY